jgi:hypothetical protein
MTNQHPITPPEELVDKWYDEWLNADELAQLDTSVAAKAARWGADQELEACCEWLIEHGYDIASPELRTSRRKPPTLKEQALTALHAVATGANDTREQHQDFDTIRKALETLPK